MSQLREMLKAIQTEKMLKLLLGEQFHTATDEHKVFLAGHVEQQIDIDVDKLLNEFILVHHANTPIAKKNKKLIYIQIAGSVVLTTAIAYAVNTEAWVFVGFLGILMILIQFLPLVYNND